MLSTTAVGPSWAWGPIVTWEPTMQSRRMAPGPTVTSSHRMAPSIRAPDPTAQLAPRTAFGPTRLDTKFGPLGTHAVLALPLSAGGRNPLLRTEVVVQTDQVSGCRCMLSRSRGPLGLPFGWIGVVGSVLALRRKMLGAVHSRNRLRGELG